MRSRRSWPPSSGSRRAWSVTWPQSLAGARELLEAAQHEFFVAVLDLNLPDAPNGEIIDLVQAHDIPIIVLTATMNDAQRGQLLEQGVIDYVIKEGVVGIDYVVRSVRRLAENQSTEVLVVDDSRVFREFLSGLLELHGFIVHTAADGIEGLARYEQHGAIQLVITDYNMPNMDGLEMVIELRKRCSPEELAIICVSETRQDGMVARFLKRGASDYLNKPFGIEEFYCRVDQNIDMLRALRTARDVANRDFPDRFTEPPAFLPMRGQVLLGVRPEERAFSSGDDRCRSFQTDQ